MTSQLPVGIQNTTQHTLTYTQDFGGDLMIAAGTRTWLVCLFVLLYSVIFVVGLMGNVLVVYVVSRTRSMWSVTNLFIANLAVSDIIMCLLAVPFTPLSGLMKNWVFGELLCHLVPMSLCVSVHVSTLTSTAIAIDRYVVIVHPFAKRISGLMCGVIIASVWLLSCAVALPLAFNQRLRHQVDGEDILSNDEFEDEFIPSRGLEHPQGVLEVGIQGGGPVVLVCSEHWPSNTSRLYYTLASLVLQYVIPSIIISFCYTRISRALALRPLISSSSSNQPQNNHSNTATNNPINPKPKHFNPALTDYIYMGPEVNEAAKSEIEKTCEITSISSEKRNLATSLVNSSEEVDECAQSNARPLEIERVEIGNEANVARGALINTDTGIVQRETETCQNIATKTCVEVLNLARGDGPMRREDTNRKPIGDEDIKIQPIKSEDTGGKQDIINEIVSEPTAGIENDEGTRILNMPERGMIQTRPNESNLSIRITQDERNEEEIQDEIEKDRKAPSRSDYLIESGPETINKSLNQDRVGDNVFIESELNKCKVSDRVICNGETAANDIVKTVNSNAAGRPIINDAASETGRNLDAYIDETVQPINVDQDCTSESAADSVENTEDRSAESKTRFEEKEITNVQIITEESAVAIADTEALKAAEKAKLKASATKPDIIEELVSIETIAAELDIIKTQALDSEMSFSEGEALSVIKENERKDKIKEETNCVRSMKDGNDDKRTCKKSKECRQDQILNDNSASPGVITLHGKIQEKSDDKYDHDNITERMTCSNFCKENREDCTCRATSRQLCGNDGENIATRDGDKCENKSKINENDSKNKLAIETENRGEFIIENSVGDKNNTTVVSDLEVNTRSDSSAIRGIVKNNDTYAASSAKNNIAKNSSKRTNSTEKENAESIDVQAEKTTGYNGAGTEICNSNTIQTNSNFKNNHQAADKHKMKNDDDDDDDDNDSVKYQNKYNGKNAKINTSNKKETESLLNDMDASTRSNSQARTEVYLSRKRRSVRMLIAMVVIFLCCWAPLNLMLLLLEIREQAVRESPYFLLVFFICHVVAMSSCLYNPFLYAWMNDSFRRQFLKALPCLHRRLYDYLTRKSDKFRIGRGSESNSLYTTIRQQEALTPQTPASQPHSGQIGSKCLGVTESHL